MLGIINEIWYLHIRLNIMLHLLYPTVPCFDCHLAASATPLPSIGSGGGQTRSLGIFHRHATRGWWVCSRSAIPAW